MTRTSLRIVIVSVALLSFLSSCAGRSIFMPAGAEGKSAASATVSSEAPSLVAAVDDPVQALAVQIGQRFDDPRFANAFWGALIQSLDTGKVWYERNADRLFMPASNEKIPTSASALIELGADFTFETTLRRQGEIANGTLMGDLVVISNGDPTLYTRFLKDPREVFRGWAAQLRAQGITRITGNVIGDDNAWDDERYGDGWSFDGFDTWYSAEIGPLQVNENNVDFMVHPPETTTGTVEIIPNLPSKYYTVVNRIQVKASGRNRVRFQRAYGSNEIVFSGEVAAGSAPSEHSPTITNPTLFYATVLREVLEEEGIRVEGQAADCDDLAGWNSQTARALPVLAARQSPPLKEILQKLMKPSQNLYAETLVRAMGWKRTGLGSFDAGRRAVEEHLAELGVEKGTYAYRDGSGLTRYNYFSPREFVSILTGMRRRPDWDVWRDAMPIAGVDGTIAKRMKGTPAEGNVRAKTGTISNVRGLSGYVTTADGEQLVFSFLVNSHLRSSRETEEVTDGVCALLAGFDRREKH